MWERHEIKNINSTERDLIYEIKIVMLYFDVVYHLRVYNNFNNQWINYDGVCGIQRLQNIGQRKYFINFILRLDICNY